MILVPRITNQIRSFCVFVMQSVNYAKHDGLYGKWFYPLHIAAINKENSEKVKAKHC